MRSKQGTLVLAWGFGPCEFKGASQDLLKRLEESRRAYKETIKTTYSAETHTQKADFPSVLLHGPQHSITVMELSTLAVKAFCSTVVGSWWVAKQIAKRRKPD